MYNVAVNLENPDHARYIPALIDRNDTKFCITLL